MIRQEWGCDKCGFRYHSPTFVKEIMHHCPPRSHTTRPAKLLDGEPAKERSGRERINTIRVEQEPVKPRGRVLKRRLPVVK